MVTDHVKGYQHVGIPAEDIEETRKFYTSLGFKAKYETINNEKPVVFYELGDILIETYERKEGVAKVTGAVDHIALNAVDIVSCYEELKKGGFDIAEGPCHLPFWDHGVIYVVINGPNKERVEFIQQFKSEEEKDNALKALGIPEKAPEA